MGGWQASRARPPSDHILLWEDNSREVNDSQVALDRPGATAFSEINIRDATREHHFLCVAHLRAYQVSLSINMCTIFWVVLKFWWELDKAQLGNQNAIIAHQQRQKLDSVPAYLLCPPLLLCNLQPRLHLFPDASNSKHCQPR